MVPALFHPREVARLVPHYFVFTGNPEEDRLKNGSERFMKEVNERLQKVGLHFPEEYQASLARVVAPQISMGLDGTITEAELEKALAHADVARPYRYYGHKPKPEFVWNAETKQKLAEALGPRVAKEFGAQVQAEAFEQLYSMKWDRRDTYRGNWHHLFEYSGQAQISNEILNGVWAGDQPVSKSMAALVPVLKLRNHPDRHSRSVPSNFPEVLRAFYIEHEADYPPYYVKNGGDIGRAVHYNSYMIPRIKPETWKAIRPNVASIAGPEKLTWADGQIIETGLRHCHGAWEGNEVREIKGPIVDRIRTAVPGPFIPAVEEAMTNYSMVALTHARLQSGFFIDRHDTMLFLKGREATPELKSAVLGALAYDPHNSRGLEADDITMLARQPWANISLAEMATAIAERTALSTEAKAKFGKVVAEHIDMTGFIDTVNALESSAWAGVARLNAAEKLLLSTSPTADNALYLPAQLVRALGQEPTVARIAAARGSALGLDACPNCGHDLKQYRVPQQLVH